MQSADNRISQFFTRQIIFKFIKFSTKYQKQLGFIHKNVRLCSGELLLKIFPT